MQKKTQIEGDGASKIVQLMRKHGHNKDVNFVLGTVTEAPPKLKIKLDHLPIELEEEDLIVAEHLTRHERVVSINYAKDTNFLKDPDIGDKDVTSTASRAYIGGEHEPYEYDTFRMEYATLQFESLLLIGDRVIVAALDEDMTYIVLDRARRYPNA